MRSFRDELLADLPEAMREKALRLAGYARIGENDEAWAIYVAVAQLDFLSLRKATESYFNDEVRAISRGLIEETIDKAVRSAETIYRARAEHFIVTQRKAASWLIITVILAVLAALGTAAAAGATGMTYYLRDDIKRLNEERDALLTSKPEWIYRWAGSGNRDGWIFLRGITPDEVRHQACSYPGMTGTCVLIQQPH